MDERQPPENPESGSQILKETLNRPEVPEQWESAYRSQACERFFETAFDDLVRRIGAPRDAPILDTGCGTCDHAIRLARRGFQVWALDFSDSMLRLARQRVGARKLQDRIRLCRGSLLQLPFPDGSFPFALCWGVLMHVAELRKAIGELARVVAPGGVLIVGESNMGSMQSRVLRFIRAGTGTSASGDRLVRRTEAGIETWLRTPGGWLLARQNDMAWLRRQFEESGFRVESHRAAQFTELYRKLASPLAQNLVHGFNAVWFRSGARRLAFGNLLLLRKIR